MLTASRIVLAVVFFSVLSFYDYPGRAAWLIAGIVVFIAAAVTDWLDGYLARRWQVESAFGRVADPLADKVLVLGAFVFLAGPAFDDPASGVQWTGVAPWMVAVMLARELLVTGLRSELESRGVAFGAMLIGQIKTFLQLVAVPLLLAIPLITPAAGDPPVWLAPTRAALVYGVVLITLLSAAPYLQRAITLARDPASR